MNVMPLLGEPPTLEQLTMARKSFLYFYNNIFPMSFIEEEFKGGHHLNNWARMLQGQKTCILAPRKHSKSVTVYAWLMWRNLVNMGRNYEVLYMSYTQTLAAYHIKNYKTLVENNPVYRQMLDITPAAGVAKYSWDGIHTHVIEPEGILSFKRGRHPDDIVLDDILSDPTTMLELAVIEKINQRVKEDVMSLPVERFKGGGCTKVIGTAQTPIDIFFDLKKNPEFAWGEYPAIVDEKNKKVLWQQLFPYERLMRIRNLIGEKAFQKEYMIKPVWSANSFFSKDQIMAVVNNDIRNTFKIDTKNEVGAGWDIGKHSHPAHFTVFEFVPLGKGMDLAVQRFQVFMDGWEYHKQLEYVNGMVHNLRIDFVNYDNTRGEMEGFYEKGYMDVGKFRPIQFTTKTKGAMASEFERRVTYQDPNTLKPSPTIVLQNDSRMINQILCVTNDLQAITTHEGHGDCYDDQTEILTDQGWKHFRDLDKTENVATLNKGGFMEWQRPTDYITKKYSGNMYSVETTQISQMVTPLHKLFVNGRLRQPHDIFNKQVRFKKNCKWKGMEADGMRIVGNRLKKNMDIPMDDWLRFLGMYIAEGHTTKRERGRYQVGISQEGEGRKIVRKILDALPFKYTENKKGFWIYDSRLGKELYSLGKSITKHLPPYAKRLSSRQMCILFDYMMMGDGHVDKTFSNYTTSSKALANDVQELLLKTGRSGNIYVRDFIGRKAPHGTTKHLHYVVSIINNKNEPMMNKHKNEDKFSDKWIDYDGMIYCVTVPNHIIYVRRNGKPCWSGNSFWSIALALYKGVKGGMTILQDPEDILGLGLGTAPKRGY